jgi:hypothetical protein
VLGELDLGDLGGLPEVVVGQFRVDDLVAVLGQEGRLDAAWDRVPAVQEEDFMIARSSPRLEPGQGNQHRFREFFHADLPKHIDDLSRRVSGVGANVGRPAIGKCLTTG